MRKCLAGETQRAKAEEEGRGPGVGLGDKDAEVNGQKGWDRGGKGGQGRGAFMKAVVLCKLQPAFPQ